MRTADELMDAYSGLSDKEKRQFDKRYKELMQFRRNLNAITDYALKGGDLDALSQRLNKKRGKR